ncbi:MAG: GH3 auxin-responsive promoter family protein [Pseudomonadota bacterium]|nr:GH3 auxin-responsive promoter family protein [Pseudomonadota bacterium]
MNRLLRQGSHIALELACQRADRRFSQQRHQLEAVQRQRLKQILRQACLPAGWRTPRSYEDYAEEVPLTRYADWRTGIEAMQAGACPLTKSPIIRYQPTSGSSERLKIIPYSQAFLDELDAAIAPWLCSLYRQSPQLKQGQHYWSVSWLPDSQRQQLSAYNLNDDSVLLSVSKRLLSAYTQAVPPEVAYAASADDALFATLCYLLAQRDLSMMSVWSPTFALQLLNHIEGWIDDICMVLQHGHWHQRQDGLQHLAAPRARRRAQQLRQLVQTQKLTGQPLDLTQIWPKLAVVSAWDTAGAKAWADVLKARLPQARFEGKGLWATEGVVTFPYQGLYPLAYQSHFYEFEDLATGAIKPAWALEMGDQVSPIISAGNGLLRYCLDDRLRVTGWYGEVPCFEFEGRRFGVDLVGEKLDPTMAAQVLALVGQQCDVRPVCLLAICTDTDATPYYLGLFEGESTGQVTQLAARLDQALAQNFHYELARDLGQLAAAQACIVLDGWAAYQALAVGTGMIEGNIKPEPLKQIDAKMLPVLQEMAG